MSTFDILVRVTAGLAAGVTASGCGSVECGANTIEKDNVCVAEAADPGTQCGPGTVYNATSGRCENGTFADGGGLCGPNTTLVIDDAGVRFCVGTGGSTDCSQPLPCPAPTGSNNLTLCGRVYNLDDSTPFDDGKPEDGEPYKTIELRVYDPISFVGNPSTAMPLTTAAADSCGRFVITEVSRPTDGFIAVATEDVTDGSNTDQYVQTGIAAPAAGGQTLSGLRAWVFKRSTDQAWSSAAGLSGGTTFGSVGVYIPIFLSGPAVAPLPAGPTAGVTIAPVDTTGNRNPKPMQDYYFTDSAPLSRKTASATPSSTGANGTGLYVNSGLNTFSGVGGAPPSTCWAKDLAAAPVGGAYVQERTAAAEFCQ